MVSPLITPLVSPTVVCSKILRHFPKTLPPLRSPERGLFDYDQDSNGPHGEHDNHHASIRPIVRLVNSDAKRGKYGTTTNLFQGPMGSIVQRRRFASKFTVTDSKDALFDDPDFSSVERALNSPEANKAFTYCMIGATGVLSAMGAKSTVLNFLTSWSASSEALAMAQVEADLSSIPEGKSVVIKWRGKPIFIRHRTAEEVQEAESVNLAELRDPQSDAERTQKPEWIVMIGICTHLGCVPLADSGDYNGWYCPCQ